MNQQFSILIIDKLTFYCEYCVLPTNYIATILDNEIIIRYCYKINTGLPHLRGKVKFLTTFKNCIYLNFFINKMDFYSFNFKIH